MEVFGRPPRSKILLLRQSPRSIDTEQVTATFELGRRLPPDRNTATTRVSQSVAAVDAAGHPEGLGGSRGIT